MINWTQILLALITTVGTVLTARWASSAKSAATEAGEHAAVAKEASLRPPPRA